MTPSLSSQTTPTRPTSEERTTAWSVIERDARYDHAGSSMSWKDHVAYQLACRQAYETEQALLGYLRDAVDAVEITDADELRERLEQDADSAFIYTLSALVYVLGCQNEDAYADELGEKPTTIEVQAAYAAVYNVMQEEGYQELVDRLEGRAE